MNPMFPLCLDPKINQKKKIIFFVDPAKVVIWTSNSSMICFNLLEMQRILPFLRSTESNFWVQGSGNLKHIFRKQPYKGRHTTSTVNTTTGAQAG